MADRINLKILLPDARDRLIFFIKTVNKLTLFVRNSDAEDKVAQELQFLETLPSLSQIITTYSEVTLDAIVCLCVCVCVCVVTLIPLWWHAPLPSRVVVDARHARHARHVRHPPHRTS